MPSQTGPSSHAERDTRGRALEAMLLIRAVEERLLALFSAGSSSHHAHLHRPRNVRVRRGRRARPVARHHLLDAPLSRPYLMYTADPNALIAEIMGRQTGTCGGRGGSQHLCKRNFSRTACMGGILPIATGVALAEAVQGSGRHGRFSRRRHPREGAVYEALNMAALWHVRSSRPRAQPVRQSTRPSARRPASDGARRRPFGIATDRRPRRPVALQAHMRAVVDAPQRRRAVLPGPRHYRLAAAQQRRRRSAPPEIAAARQRDPLADSATTSARRRCPGSRRPRTHASTPRVVAAGRGPYANVDGDAEARGFEARSDGEPPATRAFASAARTRRLSSSSTSTPPCTT